MNFILLQKVLNTLLVTKMMKTLMMKVIVYNASKKWNNIEQKFDS